MSGVLGRLASAFVAPRPGEPRAEAAEPHVAAGTHVAVVARAADAAAAGGAVGLALARPAAVLLLWGAPPAKVHAPAARRARKAASRLAARGHAVRASGRLAVVALGDDLEEAGRAAAAAGDLPVVLVVAGPRDDRADALVRACDRAIVVGDDAVAELAAGSVAALDVPCRTLVLPEMPARGLAAAGVTLAGALRRPVEEALR